MKKTMILMCAFIVFVNEGVAQWKFSAIVGPQLATFGGKDKKDWGGLNSDPEMVFRFQAGILAERRHSENMSFITGLVYSSKGTRYSGEEYDFSTNQNVDVSYTKALSYLDLPILFRYHQSEKWSFLFGPQVSFLLAAKIKNSESVQKLYQLPKTEDAKDDYTKLDVGLNLGTTYALNERMSILLLYQYGLLKIGIDEDYNSSTGSIEEQKYAIMNRVLLLSFIYTFKEQQ